MTKKPEYLDQLIDLAQVGAGGSDNKLAQMLGVSRQTVSNWRHGKKPCPPGDVALMAQIAGLEPEQWLARAVAAQYEGTPKGVKLASALGKSLVLTGAVIASHGANAAGTINDLIRCIEVLITARGFSYKYNSNSTKSKDKEKPGYPGFFTPALFRLRHMPYGHQDWAGGT